MTTVTYSKGKLITDTQTTKYHNTKERLALLKELRKSGDVEYIEALDIMENYPTWDKTNGVFDMSNGKFITINNEKLMVNANTVKAIAFAGNGDMVAHLDKYAHDAGCLDEFTKLVNKHVVEQLNEMKDNDIEITNEVILSVDISLILVTEGGALVIPGACLDEDLWYWHARDADGVVGIGSGFTSAIDIANFDNIADIKKMIFSDKDQYGIHTRAAEVDSMSNNILVELTV